MDLSLTVKDLDVLIQAYDLFVTENIVENCETIPEVVGMIDKTSGLRLKLELMKQKITG